MAKNDGSSPGPRRGTEPASAADDFEYPGNRLGMPADGSGSVAPVPRRLAALAIDWVLSTLVAYTFFDITPETQGFTVPLVFAVQSILLLTFLGTTVGKRIMGVRLAALAGGRLPWPLAVGVRTVLLCLVIPAVIYDRDHRGLHDLAAGTVGTRI